jgi:hypothetical protein
MMEGILFAGRAQDGWDRWQLSRDSVTLSRGGRDMYHRRMLF